MSLSVLTLNLWHDSGPWRQRCQRIGEWIDRLDPDLIGFQEVIAGDDYDQVAEILGARAYHCDFVKASPFWGEGKGSFGNAIASRWPITQRWPLVLPDRGDGETRAALGVAIDAPVGKLTFWCTHLHWKLHHGSVRERQVVALAQEVIARRVRDGFPPIVVGDFNAEPDSDEIRFMKGTHSIGEKSVLFYDAWQVAGCDGPGITWSNRNDYARTALEPERRIDYIFSGYPLQNGLGHLEACRVVCDDAAGGVWPSDHFGVYAEFCDQPSKESD
ncbi:MAG: endonuclease/exonuclease/phosphatase family protein [Myxococcota bacterium]